MRRNVGADALALVRPSRRPYASFQQAIGGGGRGGRTRSAAARARARTRSNRYYFEKLHLTPGTAQHTKTLGNVVRTHRRGPRVVPGGTTTRAASRGWSISASNTTTGRSSPTSRAARLSPRSAGLRGVLEDAYKGFELGRRLPAFRAADGRAAHRPGAKLLPARTGGNMNADRAHGVAHRRLLPDGLRRRHERQAQSVGAGVNILPFIDEHRLRDALSRCSARPS